MKGLRIVGILTVLLILPSFVLAQMGGGGGMQGSNSGLRRMANGAMGAGGMTQDLGIGPDGTLYVVRPVQMMSQGSAGNGNRQYAMKQELVAINPANGMLKWRLELTGGRVSEPVFGKDGRIFLALDDGSLMASQGGRSSGNGPGGGGGGMMNPGGATATQANQSRFLVITATATAATILATVTVDSDVLSSPKVVSTGSGAADYVVYVTGLEMPSFDSMSDDRDSIPAGEKTLYAFLPDGKIKFKVTIGKSQAGMMP